MTLLVNHGDRKYIGLGGIEVFDDVGNNLSMKIR